MRRFLLIIGVSALVAGSLLAIRVYRAQGRPESLVGEGRELPAPLCPSPRALNRAATDHVREAVRALNQSGEDPRDRLARFREGLGSASELLHLSLRIQPAQADSLARLAAVRWELAPPLTAEEGRAHQAVIELASTMAPRVPRVQRRLGELVLKMGLRDEALVFLRRTVELDPGRSREVIDLLASQFFTLDEIVAALPRIPDVLLPLHGPFAGQGRLGDYAALLEPFLQEGDVVLIRRFGEACLGAGRAGMLRDLLDETGEGWVGEARAERFRQLARAHHALGDSREALYAAQEAVETWPGGAIYHVQLGDLRLAAGEAEMALSSFRRALYLLASSPGSDRARARLYGKAGRAEEALGRIEAALDSYERAAALDPEEAWSARRLREIRGFTFPTPRH
jgi:tetratricopeptide (TPR) repeat protein